MGVVKIWIRPLHLNFQQKNRKCGILISQSIDKFISTMFVFHRQKTHVIIESWFADLFASLLKRIWIQFFCFGTWKYAKNLFHGLCQRSHNLRSVIEVSNKCNWLNIHRYFIKINCNPLWYTSIFMQKRGNMWHWWLCYHSTMRLSVLQPLRVSKWR